MQKRYVRRYSMLWLLQASQFDTDGGWKAAYVEMKTRLSNNEELMDAIIPKNFNVGCRRPTVGRPSEFPSKFCSFLCLCTEKMTP